MNEDEQIISHLPLMALIAFLAIMIIIVILISSSCCYLLFHHFARRSIYENRGNFSCPMSASGPPQPSLSPPAIQPLQEIVGPSSVSETASQRPSVQENLASESSNRKSDKIIKISKKQHV